MKKNKRKGFTLVELLAVIVILAIILVIAVPKVMDIINDAKKGTLESTAKMIASAAEKQYVQNKVLGKEDEITCESVVKLNDIDYEECTIEFDGDDAYVTIAGSGKFNNLYVCEGTKTGASASNEECGGATTPATCFDYELVYDAKVADKTSCMNELGDIVSDYGYTEEELNKFCEGKVVDGYTFSQNINRLVEGNREGIDYLVSKNVIKDVEEGYEIAGYDDSCGVNVSIPKKIENKLVYGIGMNAFQNKYVTGLTLPTSIRYISELAFRGSIEGGFYEVESPLEIEGELDLSKLTNLEVIGAEAFAGNHITNIKLPDNLTFLGYAAFGGNKINDVLDLSNTKIEVLEKMEALNDSYANKFTSVIFPITLVKIEDDAFLANRIIGELDLSKLTNLTTIGNEAFRNNKITSIKLPTSVTTIGELAFDDNQISGVLDLSNLINLKIIGYNAFSYNEITSIKLPTSVTTIDGFAFENNPNLINIINPSGKSFDWSVITGQGINGGCTFVTGTCGNVTIKAS